MPYADPGKRRKAKRDSATRSRAKKAASRRVGPVGPIDPAPVTLGTVVDVKTLLEEQIAAVRGATVDVIERARAIGYLVGIGLRSIEAGDFERRLDALEAANATRAASRRSA